MGALGQHAQAWTEFWQGQGEVDGCCARAPEILGPVRAHWSIFGRSLAPDSQVLDIGCGTGVAGRALVEANPSLRIIGVDFASVRVHREPRIEVLSDTRMESMPFSDGSIDAAISQFGFEYGQIEDASRELARVLRRGAPFSFLVHHARARIATDSVRHRRALQEICGTVLAAAFLAGNNASLDRQLARIRHQCPHERIVEDAAQGLRRMIGEAPAHRAEIWRGVQAALAPELVMLAELERSAVSPEAMQCWLRPMAARFELSQPAVVLMTGGQPLCWKVEGIRRASLH